MSFFSIPDVLMWPFLASLVLAGIHVYFGIHVIARNVIFVDLALAQIAALGAIVGVFLGYESGTDHTALYLYSLAFTFIGAVVFTISRSKEKHIPQEAFIGIAYTAAFAITLILLSKSALGPHELSKILKGDILWVQSDKVILTAAIYAAVGLFHFILRKQFLDLSMSYYAESAVSAKHYLFDFLFYMSFGFVVASSVTLVGVFLVFSLLVIPSVTSMMLFDSIRRRLLFGWTFAAVICFLGMKLSWRYDLPSSPLIVVLFATALVLIAFIKKLVMTERKAIYLARSVVFIVGMGSFLFVLYEFRKIEKDDYQEIAHLLKDGSAQEKIYALRVLANKPEWARNSMDFIKTLSSSAEQQVQLSICELIKKTAAEEWDAFVLDRLRNSSGDVLSCYLDLAKKRKITGSSDVLESRLKEIGDFDFKIEIFDVLLEIHNETSVDYMLETYGNFPAILRGDILEMLNAHYHLECHDIGEFKEWWTTK